MSTRTAAAHFGMTTEEYEDMLHKAIKIEAAERKHADILKMLSDHALIEEPIFDKNNRGVVVSHEYSCLECDFVVSSAGQFNEHLIRMLKGVQYGPRKVYKGEPLDE